MYDSSTLTHGSARCPAGSGCRTLKTPREPPIRCCLWPEHHIARCSQSHVRTHAKVIYARAGLSVLRQAPRLLLFAIEPPDDDMQLIVGIE
jgi:hypothetical protein